MAEYVLTCSAQPSPGEPCPSGQDAWVPIEVVQYGNLRDVLFKAPPMGDAAVFIGVTIALTVLINLPAVLGRIIDAMRRGSGL